MDRWIAKADVARVALFLAAASIAQAQQVLVVGFGQPYSDVQSAINAASSGDIILVKPPGTFYAGVTITGKSVTIIGDSTGPDGILIHSSVITGITATQSVLLRNITFEGLTISNSQGPVWVENCYMTPLQFMSYGWGPSITITSSGSVGLVSCVIQGPMEIMGTNHAAQISNSTVTAWKTIFRGGLGPPFNMATTYHGGHGCVCTSSTLFANGCTFSGGNGGMLNGSISGNFPGENGGDGIHGNPILLDCFVTAGLGSMGTSGLGLNGQPIVGTPTVITDQSRSFSATSPVREGQICNMVAKGHAWEICSVIYSQTQITKSPYLAFDGFFLIDPLTSVVLASAQLFTNGPYTFQVPVPNMPASIMGANVFLQSVFYDGGLTYVSIQPPSAVTVLDSSL